MGEGPALPPDFEEVVDDLEVIGGILGYPFQPKLEKAIELLRYQSGYMKAADADRQMLRRQLREVQHTLRD